MFSGPAPDTEEAALLPGPGGGGGNTGGGSAAFLVSYASVKALGVLALFLTYDLLKAVHLVPFFFLANLTCAVFLVVRQKPFFYLKSRSHWTAVIRHSIAYVLTSLSGLYGLTLCGPLRAVLVTRHSGQALLTGCLALCCASSRVRSNQHARARGAILFLLGAFALLFVDHDDNSPHHQAYHADHAGHHKELYTLFTHILGWTDISDHKGGVLLLCCVLAAQASVTRWISRRSAAIVGGAKRLHAAGSFVAALSLSPWAFYHMADLRAILTSPSSLMALLFFAVVAQLADFYVECAVTTRRSSSGSGDQWARIEALTAFSAAFAAGSIWTHRLKFNGGWEEVDDAGSSIAVTAADPEDHQMSPGVIFAAVLFCFATLNLTSSVLPGTRGFFVGYSSAGLPLYNLTTDSIHEAGQSVVRTLKQGLKQILEKTDSRRIFYFLLLNLFFTFVEFAYGIWTNSLGLISDGFHMLFDCSSLVMGLYAAVMARWRASKTFSYGYDRLEVLSGFVNGLFLLVIGSSVFLAAVRRLFDPPTVETERLLIVSVCGLIVNLVGIAAFSGHGHSHGGHGHSHGGGHGHSHNANMQGVFLHILADTLGSVGVIVSSLLIEYFGLFIADPICSIFIAVTIVLSVLPLIRQSAEVLLLVTPTSVLSKVNECLRHLPEKVPGVEGVGRVQVWAHSAEKVLADVTVRATKEADEQMVTEQVVRMLRDSGVHTSVVQVEKERFYLHLQGLGTKVVDTAQLLGRNYNLLGM